MQPDTRWACCRLNLRPRHTSYLVDLASTHMPPKDPYLRTRKSSWLIRVASTPSSDRSCRGLLRRVAAVTGDDAKRVVVRCGRPPNWPTRSSHKRPCGPDWAGSYEGPTAIQLMEREFSNARSVATVNGERHDWSGVDATREPGWQE
jgi:hypothetical protein